MKPYNVALALLWVLFAFVSIECLSSHSNSASSSNHSDQVVNSRGIPTGEGPSRTRNRRRQDSDLSSTSSSSGSLTPISDTDSEKSMNSKQFARGTLKFHDEAYQFHHSMSKYHQAIGDAYQHRFRDDSDAKSHFKATESSKAKKVKHRKQYQEIKSGNLLPGPIQEKKGMKFIPKIPDETQALRLINNRKIVFRKRKGLHYLSAKRLSNGKKRPKEAFDYGTESSSASD